MVPVHPFERWWGRGIAGTCSSNSELGVCAERVSRPPTRTASARRCRRSVPPRTTSGLPGGCCSGYDSSNERCGGHPLGHRHRARPPSEAPVRPYAIRSGATHPARRRVRRRPSATRGDGGRDPGGPERQPSHGDLGDAAFEGDQRPVIPVGARPGSDPTSPAGLVKLRERRHGTSVPSVAGPSRGDITSGRGVRRGEGHIHVAPARTAASIDEAVLPGRLRRLLGELRVTKRSRRSTAPRPAPRLWSNSATRSVRRCTRVACRRTARSSPGEDAARPIILRFRTGCGSDADPGRRARRPFRPSIRRRDDDVSRCVPAMRSPTSSASVVTCPRVRTRRSPGSAMGGLVVQRHRSGQVRVFGPAGVVRWDGISWHHDPPLDAWLTRTRGGSPVTSRSSRCGRCCVSPSTNSEGGGSVATLDLASERPRPPRRGASSRWSTTFPVLRLGQPGDGRGDRTRTRTRPTVRRSSTGKAGSARSACGSRRRLRRNRAVAAMSGMRHTVGGAVLLRRPRLRGDRRLGGPGRCRSCTAAR